MNASFCNKLFNGATICILPDKLWYGWLLAANVAGNNKTSGKADAWFSIN